MKFPEFKVNYELLAVIIVSIITIIALFNAVILNMPASPITGFATGTVYVNVSCTTAVTMMNNNVSFIYMAAETTNDTTDNIPLPFRIRNDGNVVVNISITANNSLFSENPNPTIYFTAACGNSTTAGVAEHNCTQALREIGWFSIPLGEPGSNAIIANLEFNATIDEAEIDINVTVPAGTAPGGKSSVLTFTGTDTSGTACP